MTFALWLAACSGERTFTSRADPRYPAPPVDPEGAVEVVVARDEDDAAGGRADPRGGALVAEGDDAITLWFDRPAGLDHVELGRLQLPVVPDRTQGPLTVEIRGLRADGTRTEPVTWPVGAAWPDPYARHADRADRAPLVCAPFERATPDLAPIVAALAGEPRLGFELTATAGRLAVADRTEVSDAECPGVLAATLELHPTLRSSLVAREVATLPTDTGFAASLVAGVDVEAAIEVWTGEHDRGTTPFQPIAAGEAAQIAVTDLSPGTRVRWRLHLRRGEAAEVGPEHTLSTARAPGEPFTFTVTSDAHLLNLEHRRAFSAMHLWRAVMARIGTEPPDFHLDLGDLFNGESYRSWDAPDAEEILRRVVEVRPYLALAEAPVVVVPGNHEGEQGWRTAKGDGLPELAIDARTRVWPGPPGPVSPAPGPLGPVAPGSGANFAFAWGDVLVVALDPYRHTVRKPHDIGGTEGSGDRWDWTLGKDQYDWLVRTLGGSHATWKLVVAHQVTGGVNEYGRGGRQAALFTRDRGSYEWGGRDPGGAAVFRERRPGWGRPVHRVLADAGVTAFVHGHDHVFAFEPALDGVAYLTVPQPSDPRYERGHAERSDIAPKATALPNSGHLRFRASARELVLEYVRSYLPGEGPDGEVAFRHVFTDCDGNGKSDLHDRRGGRPDPCVPTPSDPGVDE